MSQVVSSGVLPPIERLKGRENYNTWKIAMQSYLELEDLWACVQGTDTDTKKNARAKAKIILAIEPINYIHVESATDAKTAWKRLSEAFEDSGLTRRVMLLKKLVTTRLDSCKSVEEYVNKIITTAHQLTGIGLEVREEWIGTLLLAGLPDQYKPMIMGIENSGMKISGDAIKTKLLQDVSISNEELTGTNIEVAFHGKGENKYKKEKVKCYSCNGLGHMAYQCLKNKNKKKDAKKEAKGETMQKKKSDFKVLHAAVIPKEDWIIDSGASVHTTNQKCLFKKLSECGKSVISLVDDSKLAIDGKGDINLDIKVINSTEHIQVKDVNYVPDAKTNLLSVSQMTSKNLKVIFTKKKCKILDSENKIVATGSKVDDLYHLDVNSPTAYCTAKTQGSAELWHRRLGHLGRSNMKLLKDKHAEGLDFPNPDEKPCEVCVKGKHRRDPFPISYKRASAPLELIHTDLCGPMERNSIGGSSYFMTMIDDHTRKVWTYFLAHKSQALDCFREYKSMVENELNNKIKVVRSDNGREYVNTNFSRFLKDVGIRHQTTIPYSPQQNGRAERMNQTIVDKARCLLIDANLDKAFWAEAVSTATYLVNRTPARALKHKTPEEVWSGKKPNLSHLRVFGTRVMVHIPKQHRQKWDEKSKECIFLGYAENSKGYRLFDPSTKKVFKARDVVFLENTTTRKTENEKNEANKKEISTLDIINEIRKEAEEGIHEVGAQGLDGLSISNDEWSTAEDEYHNESDTQMLSSDTENTLEQTEPEPPRRSSRKPKPKKMDDFITYNLSKELLEDPVTREEALRSAERDHWQDAMEEEYNSLIENKTWTLVNLPPGRKALDSKWVFKTKRNATGELERYKARLVARGFAQTKGVDYEETYSPVVRYELIRLLLALAARFDMNMDHLDVTTAFLQGDLKEEVYMRQPPGFIVEGQATKVCKLKKAIYGLKQGSHAWNCKLHAVLQKLGFKRSKTDQGVYVKKKDKFLTIIAVYVDDLLLLSNDNWTKEETKRQLHKEFKMKDLGEVHNLLGMRITRDHKLGTISIDQQAYVEQIIRRFNMQDANPVKTPLDVNVKLSKSQQPKTREEKEEMSKIPYREALGSLMYASQGTRPDITQAIGLLSQYCENPGKAHWIALKRVFRYLRGTSTYKLQFTKDGNDLLEGYCDADWAGDVDNRRSTTGYIFRLQDAAISWKSKRQHSTALSTTEAEYMAITAAVQEAMWLRALLTELIPELVERPTRIYSDNQSAIKLANNSAYSARSKHIDTRYHFVREKMVEDIISLEYANTSEMVADSLTKAVVQNKNDFCNREMGLVL